MNLSIDNSLKINTLLSKKIKQIRDHVIDCTDTTSFLARSEHTFLLSTEGVVFYFQDVIQSERIVPILLTWTELQSFLAAKN